MTLKGKGLIVLVVSLIGVGVSLAAMLPRIRQYNESLPEQFHFQTELRRSLKFAERSVTLQDSTTSDGKAALTLTYGDASKTFRVKPPMVPNYADLTVYQEHVTFLAFTPIRDGITPGDRYSDADWRAVVVNRRTADGWDEETWGNVRVRDWVFELHELKADGTISTRLVQLPDRRGRLPAEVDARRAAAKEGRTLPDGPLPPEMVGGIELVGERTWEWQACLFSVPRAHVSRYRYQDDAVEAMAWTFGGMGVSIMAAMAGVAMMMAGSIRRARPGAA
jgi:hypothetical protein